MPPLREEAETLRLELGMGLIEPAEVISWADRLIVELDDPPTEIIDIAVATSQPPDELGRLLNRVPGVADLASAAHRALDTLRSRMAADSPHLGIVVNMLYIYSFAAVVPEGEQWAARNFSYEYECLAYFGTIENLGLGIDEFLAAHSTEAGPDA